MNTIGAKSRDLKVHEAILNELIPALRATLDVLVSESRARINAASDVYSGIREEYNPRHTGATELDLRRPVNIAWKENPATLREGIRGFSRKAMESFADSIRLTAEDTDLVGQIDGKAAESMVGYAHPLFRQSRYFDKRKLRGTPDMFVLPEQFVEKDKEGKIIGIKGIDWIPEGYKPVPTPSGRVMVVREMHGVSPIEMQNFVDGLQKLLALPPHERETFFTVKGDMEQMLPEWAKALAEAEWGTDKKKKIIVECSCCKLAFCRAKTEEELKKPAAAASGTEQVPDLVTAPPYVCEGCR